MSQYSVATIWVRLEREELAQRPARYGKRREALSCRRAGGAGAAFTAQLPEARFVAASLAAEGHAATVAKLRAEIADELLAKRP